MNISKEIVNPHLYFKKIRQKHKNIILFGAGAKGKQTIVLLRNFNLEPNYICDNDEEKWGKTLEGIKIGSYEQMKSIYQEYCIIITVAINNAIEIKTMLKEKEERNQIYHSANPFKVDDTFLEYQEVINLEEKCNFIYENLGDDISKNIFIKMLNYKMTGNAFPLYGDIDGDSFFDENLMKQNDNHLFVDVGAYTGDTVCQFLEFSGGKYKQIVAFEPDAGNYESLCDFIRFGRVKRTNLINQGVYSKEETMTFYTAMDYNRVNYDSPNFYRDISFTADKKAIENMKGKNITSSSSILKVNSLDNFLKGMIPTIIKINALAMDLPILQGSANIIQINKPIVMLEYATRPDYLFVTIPLLKSFQKDYKFYFRQKDIFGDSKTIMYAI